MILEWINRILILAAGIVIISLFWWITPIPTKIASLLCAGSGGVWGYFWARMWFGGDR